MFFQAIYEFLNFKSKLKQWEFDYFRDIEVKKVIHGTKSD